MPDVMLIGRDIAYSASPPMHDAAFAALGLPHRYLLADVESEQVEGMVARIRSGELLGANVTRPHKHLVAQLVDELVGDAAEIGAVNTVLRTPDGSVAGRNTDVAALVDAVTELRPAGVRHAVLLGAGGVTGAVCAALARLGVPRVTRVARTPRGEELEWGELPRALADADLVINATPVGTGSLETPVGQELLRPDLAVLDLVYRPCPPRLVREARAVGARAASGAGVLLGQGWRSFEAWTGCPAPVGAMRSALRRELGDAVDV